MTNNDLLPIWPKPKRPVVEIDNSGETDVADILQGYLDGRWGLVNSDGTPFLSGGAYKIYKPLSFPVDSGLRFEK